MGKMKPRFGYVIPLVVLIILIPSIAIYAGGTKKLQAELDECNEKSTTLESENSNLKSETSSLKSQKNSLKIKIINLQSEKQELEQEIADVEVTIAIWRDELETHGFEPEDPAIIFRTVESTLEKEKVRIVELEADMEEMNRQLEQKNRDLEQVKVQQEQVKRKLAQSSRDLEQVKIENALYERKLTGLEEETDELLQALEVYEPIQEESVIPMDIVLERINEVLKEEIVSGEVRVFKGTLGLILDIVSTHMFEMGSVEINPRGKVILGKIAGLLEELDGYFIGVIGNADSKPIVTPALKKKYPTNWELSSVRGAAVVRFMLSNADISPGRMIAMGLGKYQPIDNNETEQGRGNNRRTDIVLLPIDMLASVITGAEIK